MISNINNKILLTDEEIIKKLKKKNDNHLFGELISRYIHLVFNLCYRYLKNDDASKDATIEIFEELLHDIKKYDIHHFRSWLYVKAKNYCLQDKNKKKNPKISFFEQIDNLFMEFPFFFNYNIREIKLIENDQIENAVDELNKEQKICIQLFYYENKSYKEISEQTGYTINQVKSHLQNGKRNLKNILNSIISVLT